MITETENNVRKEGAYLHPLHQRWDDKLSPQIVELFVKNADLFEDDYDSDRIERKILRHIQMYKEDMSLYDSDDWKDRLEQLAKEDLSYSQMRVVHSIATEVDRYLTGEDDGIRKSIEQQMSPELHSFIEECSILFKHPHAAKSYIQDLYSTILNEANTEYDASNFLYDLEALGRSNLTRSEKAQLADLADALYESISETLRRNRHY